MTIRERREAKGYTQQRLADEVGVTQTAICLIESGRRHPSFAVAKRLGTVLDFDWTECYDDDQLPEASER